MSGAAGATEYSKIHSIPRLKWDLQGVGDIDPPPQYHQPPKSPVVVGLEKPAHILRSLKKALPKEVSNPASLWSGQVYVKTCSINYLNFFRTRSPSKMDEDIDG